MNDQEMHDVENRLNADSNLDAMATVNNNNNIDEQATDNNVSNLSEILPGNIVGNLEDFSAIGCNHIPVEVWMIILRYVDPEDLPAVAMVNHKFADLVNECSLWTSLKISARKLIDYPKLFLDKICWYTWLKNLYLIGDHQGCRPRPNFQDIVHGCQSKVLDSQIVNMDDKVPEKFFRNVATHCQRLKVLRIFDCVLDQSYINQLAVGCPELKVIELSRCELVGVGLSLPRFKNLRVFNMVDCDYQKST